MGIYNATCIVGTAASRLSPVTEKVQHIVLCLLVHLYIYTLKLTFGIVQSARLASVCPSMGKQTDGRLNIIMKLKWLLMYAI